MPTIDFTSAGTWTVPSGVFLVDPYLAGGGGGGALGGAAQRGGGGSGALSENPGLAVTPGEVLTVTPGAAGAAGTSGAGGNGATSFLSRGATTLVSAFGGTGAPGLAGGAGGTAGGVGTSLTAGNAGLGGALGGAGGGGFSGYGAGGNGGDNSISLAAQAGGVGVVRLTWVTPTLPADALSYSLALGAVTFKHQGRIDAAAIPFSLALGDVTFKHQGRLVADAVAFNVSLGAVDFGKTTRLAADPISYALTLGEVTFSTSGGTPPATPTNLVLPNRSPSTRSIQATWASLRFRQNDTVVGRTQKLELLREKVTLGFTRTMMISITDGLSTADPAEPLLRLQLLEAMEIGTVTANAGNAATSPVAFIVKKNGASNGTITFTGTTGVAAGITDYLAGDLFEIYPPATADATLDDVSISIPVSIG